MMTRRMAAMRRRASNDLRLVFQEFCIMNDNSMAF